MNIPETFIAIAVSALLAAVGWLLKLVYKIDRRLLLMEMKQGTSEDTEIRKRVKLHVFFPPLFALALFTAGCGAMEKVWFKTEPAPYVTTNTAGAVVTNYIPILVPGQFAQHTAGSLEQLGGPVGGLAGQLFIAGLTAFAWWTNRKALKRHIEKTTT